MEDESRTFTRAGSAERNAQPDRVVPRKSRQFSLDSGIAEEEVFVRVSFSLDLDYDMSEEEDSEDADLVDIATM